MSTEYPKDVEGNLNTQDDYAGDGYENEPLISSKETENSPSKRRFSWIHVFIAFLAGVLVQFLVGGVTSGSISPPDWSTSSGVSPNTDADNDGFVPPYVGSTEVHNYPPTNPTGIKTELFPTNVGYSGPTPTGAEPAVFLTAPSYPQHSGAANLLVPPKFIGAKTSSGKHFDLFRHWGNLSPWFSVPKGAFGVHSGPETPETCRVTSLHFVHRHGARYPTGNKAYGSTAKFATKLHDFGTKWNARGSLSFLNDWTYKLGEEILTPFGRHQLFDLGVSMRMKYGYLLKNFTETNTLPVFRTESQNRMWSSAMHFAIGFFGYPFEGKYEQSITIESHGINNTLSPDKTCHNENHTERTSWYVRRWVERYLKTARKRLNAHLHGIKLTEEDVYAMQMMCAYETVALGYSRFCELFTVEEWEGFDYSLDLYFWYDSAFGSPFGKILGIGYVQELVARLTQTPIPVHNTSTNGTLDDNPITFPLDGRSLYVDATHEVVVLQILTALNLTTLAESGPLPYDHIPKQRSFRASYLAPFATNIQFQLLSCAHPSLTSTQQIRVIVNDGVVPLSSLKGCPKDSKHGLCPVDGFVESMKEGISELNWNWYCNGNWTLPQGDKWITVDGTVRRDDVL